MLVWQLLVIALLILLNGFFAMAELAVLSSRRARLEQMAEERVHGARAALKLLEDPTRLLSTAQAGITLIGVFAGAYSGATLAGPLSRLSPSSAVTPIRSRSAWWLSSSPTSRCWSASWFRRRIAFNNPERIAASVAPIMARLSFVGAPVVFLLRASTNALVKLLRIPDGRKARSARRR